MADRAIKDAVKGGSVVFIGSILGAGLDFLIKIVIARFWGPTGYGLINLGLSILMLAAVFSLFGLETGIARFVSFYAGNKEFEKVKGTIFAGTKIALFFSIILGCLIFLFSRQLSISCFHESDLIPIIKIFAFALPFVALSKVLLSALRGFKCMKYLVYCRNLFGKGVILFVLIFFHGCGIINVAFAYFLGFIFMCTLGFYYLKLSFPGLIDKRLKKISTKKELLSFSWPVIAASSIAEIRRKTDIFLLAYFLSTSQVGLYSAAFPIATLLAIPICSFDTILLPVASDLYSQGKINEIRHLYTVTAKWLFYFAFPLFLVFFFLPENILLFLFGVQYINASTSLKILSIGYIGVILIAPRNQIILAMGRSKIIFLLAGIGAGSNVILNLILIPYFGINGAALATSISLILMALVGLGFLYYYLRVHPFGIDHLKCSISSATVFGIFFILHKIMFSQINWAFPVLWLSYWLVNALVLLIIIGLNSEDEMIISAIENKTRLNLGFIRKLGHINMKANF